MKMDCPLLCLVKKLKIRRLFLALYRQGGSKDFQEKILKLANKPLIQYTIEAAQNSKLLDNFIFQLKMKKLKLKK